MKAPPESPIRESFKPAKQGAQRHYGVHPYFTKRAWNVVQEYIKHFTGPGETVLDPFGGAGVTAVESLVLRRKAIYADINPWACFLARMTALSPVNLGALCAAFEQIEKETRDCLEELWRTPNELLEKRPVESWYPKGVRLPRNADVAFVEELFTPRMLHGLASLRAAVMRVEDRTSRELLLFAFSATLARINRTFLSAANRSETRGGSAVFSLYRYKVARNAVELPLWPQFAQRFKKVLDAKRETNLLIGDFYKEEETATFRSGSATRLSEWIKPGSVDYVYTDPPYGGNIAYLDLSTMWTSWLNLEVTDRDRREEIIEGGEAGKTAEDYSRLMRVALAQIHETLKKGGWLSVVFAHRDTAYWESLVDACEKAGFAYVNTVVQPIGVVWSMHKKKNPPEGALRRARSESPEGRQADQGITQKRQKRNRRCACNM
jgi:16S rRNA G966 N2-methylase RsmD